MYHVINSEVTDVSCDQCSEVMDVSCDQPSEVMDVSCDNVDAWTREIVVHPLR